MIHRISFADSPAQGYWHEAMVNDLLDRLRVDVNLLVTPGHFRDGEAINLWLEKNAPAIVWVLGDEEGDCPFWEVNAPVWRQFPNPHRPYWPDRVLPLGYTPHTRPALAELGIPLDKRAWVFAGQDTNERRHQCVTALQAIDPERVHPSATFAGGLDPAAYIEGLWRAEWAPAPAGNVRADSFRAWEALEAGAVPILDATSPHRDRNSWGEMLGQHPMPVLENWHDVEAILAQPAPMAKVGAWYTRYKRNLMARLVDDWYELIGEEPWPSPVDRITTIITASPLPTDPKFEILAATVESVRAHLEGEIIIAFDGSRAKADTMYEELIRRVSWWANQHWPEVMVWYTGHWKHQAGTIREVLPHVRTGCLLMVEADTPLNSLEIPWGRLVELIYLEQFNSIRLHYDTSIHPEHEYLMRGTWAEPSFEVTKTVQYSQRPHLVLGTWYRDLLEPLPSSARTYVEDWVYGRIANAPWEEHRLGIFTPPGNMQRSYHLDGRGGEPKGEFWW